MVTGDHGPPIKPEAVQQINYFAGNAVAARLVPGEGRSIENGDPGVRPCLQRSRRGGASRWSGADDYDVIALGHVPTVRISD